MVQYKRGTLSQHAVGARLQVGPYGVPATVDRTASGAKRLRFAKAQNAVERTAQVDAALAAGAAKRARASSPMSKADAQKKFNSYYGTRRGASGKRFKTVRGLKSAKTYDVNHTSKNITGTMKYGTRHGPRLYDYTGVDTGPKRRKPLSAKQRENLALGRRGAAAGRAMRAAQKGGWW